MPGHFSSVILLRSYYKWPTSKSLSLLTGSFPEAAEPTSPPLNILEHSFLNYNLVRDFSKKQISSEIAEEIRAPMGFPLLKTPGFYPTSHIRGHNLMMNIPLYKYNILKLYQRSNLKSFWDVSCSTSWPLTPDPPTFISQILCINKHYHSHLRLQALMLLFQFLFPLVGFTSCINIKISIRYDDLQLLKLNKRKSLAFTFIFLSRKGIPFYWLQYK